jgi:hypothetical protein
MPRAIDQQGPRKRGPRRPLLCKKNSYSADAKRISVSNSFKSVTDLPLSLT